MSTFIVRLNKRVIFYNPNRSNSFWENKVFEKALNLPSPGKLHYPLFLSSKIDIDDGYKIISFETLIKHADSTLETKTQAIPYLVNLQDLQYQIRKIFCFNPESTPLVSQNTCTCTCTPSFRQSHAINTQKYNHPSIKDLSQHSIFHSRKNLKPNPPIFFAVSEQFLKWINQSKPPKIDKYHFEDERMSMGNGEQEVCRCKHFFTSTPVSQDHKSSSSISSSNRISSNSTHCSSVRHQVSKFFKSHVQGSMAWYSSDLDKIANKFPSNHSSQMSDPTLKFNPYNTVIPKYIYPREESSHSSDIDEYAGNYKKSPKIWMDEVAVESDNKYFYIYSLPTPPNRPIWGSKKYFEHK